MLQQFENLRNEIRLLMINDKDYGQSIAKLKEYYSKIRSTKDNIDSDLWFVNYNIALSYKKLGDLKNSIRYAKRALKIYSLDTEYNQALWLLGSSYEVTGNIKKAINIYRRCSHYYRTLGADADTFRICAMFNIAKLLKQANTMELIIKAHQTQNYRNTAVKTYGDMTKDSVLSDMQKELFQLYIDTLNHKGAMRFVHTILDKDLKKECMSILRNKILVA